MADTYIDQAEAIRYNKHTLGTLPSIASLSPEISAILTDLSALHGEIGGELDQAGDTRAQALTTAAELRALSDQVNTRLGRLLEKCVDQLKDGASFELTRLFPTRSKQGIGKSVADRAASLSEAIGGLKLYKAEIKDSDLWLTELTTLNDQFTAAIAANASSGAAKLTGTRELGEAIAEWRTQYGAAKYVVRGVLRRNHREAEWKDHFMDLKQG